MAMAAAACCQHACAVGAASRRCDLQLDSASSPSCHLGVSAKHRWSSAVSSRGLRKMKLGAASRQCVSLESTFARFGALSRSKGGQSRRQLEPVCVVSDPADVEIVDNTQADMRVPVTVITGFLGSGKTTLLNHILTSEHGKRIAVIENEFGEVDIDGSLVASKQTGKEDILLLNNGCLCCTVRGDLLRMLSELVLRKRDMFDHVIIETTGLANPLPIIQTFFFEEELARFVKLDGVVTLVDAKHVTQHIEEIKPEGIVNEAVEQIAYADRIILNKTDLVGEPELHSLSRQIRRINGLATVKRATYGSVDVDYVLGVGGYELERVEAELKTSTKAATNEHEHKDEHEHSHHDHDHDHHDHHDHEDHSHEHSHEHDHVHDHTHDPGVSSVSIVCGGALDTDKINDWLENLLEENKDNIYRMKGVLSIDGFDSRFVFQGVHSLFEGSPDRPWREDEERINKMVFIGKNLDEDSLRSGFKNCIV